MRRIFNLLIVTALLLCAMPALFAQKDNNGKLVQVTGVVRLQDTSDVIPYMGVYVKNLSAGTLSNENGLFSLLAHKGDTIVFSRLGFAPREIVIPANWEKNFYTTTQYFIQDTFMLNEYVMRAYMTADEFDYAMRYKEFDPDINEVIKENTSKDVIAMMMKNLPQGAGEGAALLQRQAAYQNAHLGQQHPIGLFNPFSWAEFYKSVQRGDYKKKKKN